MVFDTEWHDGSRVSRYAEQTQLAKAITRTQQLLGSPAASQNPELEAIWRQRLERQQANFTRVCR